MSAVSNHRNRRATGSWSIAARLSPFLDINDNPNNHNHHNNNHNHHMHDNGHGNGNGRSRKFSASTQDGTLHIEDEYKPTDEKIDQIESFRNDSVNTRVDSMKQEVHDPLDEMRRLLKESGIVNIMIMMRKIIKSISFYVLVLFRFVKCIYLCYILFCLLVFFFFLSLLLGLFFFLLLVSLLN